MWNENVWYCKLFNQRAFKHKWWQFDKSAGFLAINYDVEITWQLISTKTLREARLRTSLLYLRDASADADAYRGFAQVSIAPVNYA